MVYIHIPFCRSHCTYCGFYSEILRREDHSTAQKFICALLREITRAEDEGELQKTASLNTLYIGGGTPSVLEISQLAEVVNALRQHGEFEEFTIEVNPDDILSLGPDYVLSLRALGVNRISMGVQSFDDACLRRMGRRHSAGEAAKAFALLREGGFDNISVDLIFGFDSGVNAASIRQGLERLSGETLPEHFSCYQLSIEEGSGLEKMISRGAYSMPSDRECEKQYYEICSLLQSLGYEHYEISNWAKSGRRARHNSGYWSHAPYLGLGPGAHSLLIEESAGTGEINYVRRWNSPDLAGYVCGESFPRGSETLTPEQLHEEKLMLGLRTSGGVPEALVDASAAEKALQLGNLERIPSDKLRIPEGRWFVSDAIIASLF